MLCSVSSLLNKMKLVHIIAQPALGLVSFSSFFFLSRISCRIQSQTDFNKGLFIVHQLDYLGKKEKKNMEEDGW